MTSVPPNGHSRVWGAHSSAYAQPYRAKTTDGLVIPEDRGIAAPAGRDSRDVVGVDDHRSEVGPLALVVPVGPERDMLEATLVAQVARIARRPLNPERGDEALAVVVKPEAFELLEAHVGLGVVEGLDDRLQIEAEA